jgi:tetratricopeptide (TPR) repeat protein
MIRVPGILTMLQSFCSSTRLAVLGLALALPLQAQETDTVYLRDGATEVGKVLEENLDGVQFQPEKGAKKLLAWDNVQSIQYFDAPEELANGLASLGAGNPEAALAQFQALLGLEGVRGPQVQNALFHAAFSQQRLGQTDAAIASYAKVLKDFPKTRYLRSVGENLIELHLGKNDVASARAALDGIGVGAKGTEGLEPLLALLEARFLETQKKFAEARERYAGVESLAGAPAAMAQEGKLGRARMLLRENKSGEAEPLLRALVGESASPRVQSGAWNGIGEIQATDGRAKKDAEKILEGLYAYLRTVVQYKPLPGESTEEHERALAGAANCFQLLSELEQNSEKKKLYRERQRERLDQLQRDYPGSSFLPKK